MKHPQWLSEKQVAAMTNIAISTLRNWRNRGVGPKYDKPSPRVVRYPLEEVEAFMRGEGRNGQ